MSSGAPHVLIDANVFFSKTLRDWILLCQMAIDPPMYHLYWTEDILAETIANLRKKYPTASDSVSTGVRDRIVNVLPDGRISGYTIDDAREYRDRKDAHVHAAATHGNVDLLLTNNIKDFTTDDLDNLPYELITADDFLILIDDSAPRVVRKVTRQQTDHYSQRRNSHSLPDALDRAGAPDFAARVLRHLQAEHC